MWTEGVLDGLDDAMQQNLWAIMIITNNDFGTFIITDSDSRMATLDFTNKNGFSLSLYIYIKSSYEFPPENQVG